MCGQIAIWPFSIKKAQKISGKPNSNLAVQKSFGRSHSNANGIWGIQNTPQNTIDAPASVILTSAARFRPPLSIPLAHYDAPSCVAGLAGVCDGGVDGVRPVGRVSHSVSDVSWISTLHYRQKTERSRLYI